MRLLTLVDVCISLNIASTGRFIGPRYTLLPGETSVCPLPNDVVFLWNLFHDFEVVNDFLVYQFGVSNFGSTNMNFVVSGAFWNSETALSSAL